MGETVELRGKVHHVVELREVAAPQGDGWMRLEDAEAAGVRLNGYLRPIGPRRRGVVYYGAYWGNVNTVHDVFVQVTTYRERGRFAGRRVIGFQVVEQDAGDGRIRRHMTSWERRNEVLRTPGTE